MKTKLVPILCAIICIETALLIVGHRYEFHTDTFHAYDISYPEMWRCDRFTGTVEKSANGANWEKVENQVKLDIKPWVPPATDPIIKPAGRANLPDFGNNAPIPPPPAGFEIDKPKMTAEQFLDSTNNAPDWAKQTNSAPRN